MRSVVISDKEIHVSNAPDPVCGSEDLLVAVKSAGLNAADILQKNGLYPAPEGIPQDIPGLEFAGEVIEIGSKASGFDVGDKVMGIVGGAAQAELCTIHYSNALRVPDNLDILSAGGFCETYLTAFDALVRQANLRSGERLLINGAAGGVGLSAIALASAMSVQVTASARHIEHHDSLRELGAKAVLPEHVEDNGPYDVVLELVGAPNMPSNLAHLAPEGRICVIGIGAGAKCEIDFRVLLYKRAKIFGSALRNRSTGAKAMLTTEAKATLLPLSESGKLPVIKAGVFDFESADDAYKKFTSPGKLGKIILAF